MFPEAVCEIIFAVLEVPGNKKVWELVSVLMLESLENVWFLISWFNFFLNKLGNHRLLQTVITSGVISQWLKLIPSAVKNWLIVIIIDTIINIDYNWYSN